MSSPTPIPLTPTQIFLDEPLVKDILTWRFAEKPFYEGNVKRLLLSDIPDRVGLGFGRIWVYRDPGGDTVGFGTLDVCKDINASRKTGTILTFRSSPFQKRGHGQSIVKHLIAEADFESNLQGPMNFSNHLFLDVYTANKPAISLYAKCGFVALNEDAPILDPQENDEPYIIMAKNIASA